MYGFRNVIVPCSTFAAALKTTSAARWSSPNWQCQPRSVPLPRRTCPGRIRWIPCWATVCSTRRSPSKRSRPRGTSRRPGADLRASRRQSTCFLGCPERGEIQPTVRRFCQFLLHIYVHLSLSIVFCNFLLATQLLKNKGIFQTPTTTTTTTVNSRPRTRQSTRPIASPDRTECAVETSTASIPASFTRSPPPPPSPPLVDRLVCPSRRDPTSHPLSFDRRCRHQERVSSSVHIIPR